MVKDFDSVLYTGKFTSINEFDSCTQLWHPVGFQGPFFLIRLKSDEMQFLILNQNSTQDFVRPIKRGMNHEFSKHQNWFYFHFQDEQRKVYNIWFQSEDDFKEF